MKAKTQFTEQELSAIATGFRALPKDEMVDYLQTECWSTTEVKGIIREALDDPQETHRAYKGLVILRWLSRPGVTARHRKSVRVSRVIFKNFADIATGKVA